MKKEEKKLWQKILSGLGLGLCICLIPILAVNITIIIESRVHPDRVPGVLGLTPMVVVTESMSPVIEGGDMIVTRKVPAESLMEGDIIAYFDPSFATKTVTTHRITEITTAQDGTLMFITRGDANNQDDPKPVSADMVVGLYRGKIPKLGKLTLFMRTMPGLILFVLLPVVIFAVLEIAAAKAEGRRRIEENDALRRELESLQTGPTGR